MSSEDHNRSDETSHLFKDAPEDKDESTDKSSLGRYLIGTVVLLVAVLTFPVTTACAQALGGVVPPFELNLWRYLAELVLITPLFLAKGRDVKPERSQVMWLLLAALMSSSYNVCYYTASLYLPLATQAGVSGALNLVILSLLLLAVQRTCTIRLALAVSVALLGTVCIIQPEVIFRGHSKIMYSPVCTKDSQPLLNKTWDDFEISTQPFIGLAANFTVTSELTTDVSSLSSSSSSSSWPSSSSSSSSSSSPNQLIGYVLLLACSVFYCIQGNVVHKKLSDLSSSLVNFSSSVTGVAVSLVLMPVFEDPALPSSSVCMLLLLGHAAGLGISNICTQRAFQVFQPTIVALASRLYLVIAFVAQRTVMKSINAGIQNSWEIVGVSLVLIGNSISPVHELYTEFAK